MLPDIIRWMYNKRILHFGINISSIENFLFKNQDMDMFELIYHPRVQSGDKCKLSVPKLWSNSHLGAHGVWHAFYKNSMRLTLLEISLVYHLYFDGWIGVFLQFDEIVRYSNPYNAERGIFQGNKVSTMTDDALGLYMTMTSAAIVLNMQDAVIFCLWGRIVISCAIPMLMNCAKCSYFLSVSQNKFRKKTVTIRTAK